MSSEDIVAAACDASYAVSGYRSFEYASFEARRARTCALLNAEAAPARDLLLAIAGLVRPVSGSLTVAGTELAASRTAEGWGLRARRAAPLPRGTVGIGIFSGIADISGSSTVEEAVAREMRLRGPRGEGTRRSGGDVLDYLAAFGIATEASRRADKLASLNRARLSAALACVGAPQVAVVDLADPFIGALTRDEAVALVGELGAAARAFGCALVLATPEPAAARAADAAFALDIDAAEALRACGGVKDTEVSAS